MIHFKIFRNSHVSDEGLLSSTEFQAGSAPALRASLAHGSKMEEPTTASLKHASIHHQYANINSSLISFAIRDEVQVCAYVRGVFPPSAHHIHSPCVPSIDAHRSRGPAHRGSPILRSPRCHIPQLARGGRGGRGGVTARVRVRDPCIHPPSSSGLGPHHPPPAGASPRTVALPPRAIPKMIHPP